MTAVQDPARDEECVSLDPETGKADFGHVYDQPDPRGYFCTLGALGYEIPWRARPVFASLVGALRSGADDDKAPPRLLDLCCSYGVNAALLRCDVTMDELIDRYASPELAAMSPEELCEADSAFYNERRRPDAVSVHGLDLAGNAVTYGCRAGLLDKGWTENLETGDPSPRFADCLDGIDMITTTGGVGYITERTFERVIGAQRDGSVPWVAAFVLRMYRYDDIATTLGRHGLVTEKLPDVTFPQRRFASEDERSVALEAVTARGLDPAGREDSGWYHADFFLSRPAEDVERTPLPELLGDVAQA